MTQTSFRFRHLYLLVALSLTIVVRPLIADSMLNAELLDAMVLITALIGAIATSHSRRFRRFALLLVVIALASRLTMLILDWLTQDSEAVPITFLVSLGLAYVTIAAGMLRSLLTTSAPITPDTIYGAIAIYLMFGLAWTTFYCLTEYAAPGSFRLNSTDPVNPGDYDRFLGFSFVTMTTVGYGNMTPATPRADALTTLQALVGQFYMAVIVARLVAMQIVNRPNTQD